MAITSDELAVAEILLSLWDPLDARGFDADPQHEYRHEAARTVELLHSGVDRQCLTAHLTAERRTLTSIDAASKDGATAAAILEWWAART